ncbi:MAG: 4-alpha-glucanotransferase [Anaerolineae bacterium]|nr:4-alpha-glucanotransferase [Anaerolineae bacterium]MDW8172753.1 4-alpha-glucanotransferase [Anaerolineae bacterium]
MSLFPRSAGVLLHPTSLPGRYGIGDLGDTAYRWVDWLVSAGQSVWQILPLGPTSYGDSPYQTLSAFAGNPNLISLDRLQEAGWLSAADLADTPDFPIDHVDYGWVISWRESKLAAAYKGFLAKASAQEKRAFAQWCADNTYWLEDFALFAALKHHHDGRPWVEWDKPLASYRADALEKARQDHAVAIDEQRWQQWVFYSQWYELKYYANRRGVRLFGDIPIFVAHDSADVWANQGDYTLDADGQPVTIAGVPPDYFSPTGQRWGNPLYRWDVMKAKGYAWWISRLKAILSLVDYIRIDHFRGFEAYWEIQASEKTAEKGQWIPGPGADLFQAIQAALGQLPIIAEDLGVITPGVEALRDGFGLPGMKVLQFAWSDPTNVFLPHNHPMNCVVYSGTHDNNTTLGWWKTETDEPTRHFLNQYIQAEAREINWLMIRLALASSAHTAIVPLQDILGLGSEGRMNTPGKESGNWKWRFQAHQLTEAMRERLAFFTWLYQRRPDQRERAYGDQATAKVAI